jgi:MFS family permease
MFVAVVLLFACMGPFYGLVQMIAPADRRAIAVATFSLSLSVLGAGLGPFLVGVLSDVLQPAYSEAEALRLALCSVPLAALLSGALLVANRGRVSKELAN